MVQIVEDDDDLQHHHHQQQKNQNHHQKKKQSDPEEEEEEEEEFLEMESSPLRSTQPYPPPADRRLRSPSKPIPIPIPLPLPAPELEQVVSSVVVVSRSIGAPAAVEMSKVDPGEDGFLAGRSEEDGGGGGGRTPSRTVSAILWRQRREAMVKRAALGFRVCEIVLCLISFSVMAADKTRGWAGDSFDRYQEYK
ncbi:hypothetical protein Scep_017788 [Stephania cephalantha]|uniref:CASP-like protein n=1 Tax=Stephania cephalantha TaxID=152367 RepID=A0AAP0NVZ4_9MAGN